MAQVTGPDAEPGMPGGQPSPNDAAPSGEVPDPALAAGGASGGTVAGGSVAGGAGSGGSVAGGSVAGGSVAGGSVAGGSVAGGSVAGGSVAGSTVAGGASPTGVRVGRRSRPWAFVRYAVGLALAGVALWAVLGRRGELAGLSQALAHLRPEWLVLGAVAEAGSYVAFAVAQRRLLAAAGVPTRLGPVAAIVFVTTAITNSVPAGPVVATVFGFRRFRRLGASDVEAGWVLMATLVAAGTSLALLAAVGLAVAGAEGASADLFWVTAVVVVLAVVGAVLLVQRRALAWLARQAGRGLRAARRRVRPGLAGRGAAGPGRSAASGGTTGPVGAAGDPANRAAWGPGAADVSTPTIEVWSAAAAAWRDALARSRRALAAIGTVRVRPSQMAAAVLWTAGNWLLDGACLVMAYLAVGAAVPWRGLLLAYGAGQLAANLPITPGGLGVVEGSMTIALVAFGGDAASTVTAVLLYRLLSYWAPLPLGWATWGALAWGDRRAAALPSPRLVTAGPLEVAVAVPFPAETAEPIGEGP